MISKNLITHEQPKSPVSEAYRMIRTNLHYSSIDKKLQVIEFTSSGQAEGKSTTVANVAITMAQAEKKVVIVDCDLRKPRLHKYFKIPNTVGLTNIIVEDIKVEETIQSIDEIPNLNIITCGSIPPDPSELLGSKKMKTFLDSLREKYDYIILDVPPVGQVTDAAVLGPICDGVILTVASGQTNIEAAKHAKDILVKVNAKILGVVLTKIERKTSGYYYYNYYSYYYGDDGNKKRKKKRRKKTKSIDS